MAQMSPGGCELLLAVESSSEKVSEAPVIPSSMLVESLILVLSNTVGCLVQEPGWGGGTVTGEVSDQGRPSVGNGVRRAWHRTLSPCYFYYVRTVTPWRSDS